MRLFNQIVDADLLHFNINFFLIFKHDIWLDDSKNRTNCDWVLGLNVLCLNLAWKNVHFVPYLAWSDRQPILEIFFVTSFLCVVSPQFSRSVLRVTNLSSLFLRSGLVVHTRHWWIFLILCGDDRWISWFTSASRNVSRLTPWNMSCKIQFFVWWRNCWH